MILGKKVRLYPTEQQELKLWQCVGTARFIYNWTLAKQEENYINGGKFISDNDLRKELTVLKQTEEYKWLNEVSNNVAKQSVKDACNAYKTFFKGLAYKPRFKSIKRSKKSFYNDNMKLKVKPEMVLIEKVGWIKTNEQIPMDVKYTNPRISYDNKYWYLSVGLETKENYQELTDVSLGVDLGLKDLAVCSDGKVYKNINKTIVVKKLEKRLRRLQRKVSRKYEENKKGKEYVKTSNIIKLEKRVQLLHRKLGNIRKNYLHQTTTEIVKTKPFRVVIEDINVKGIMKNRHLSKAIAKQGFYEFRRMINYKCKFNGIELIIADRFYPSSKTCSECKSINKNLKLSDRVYNCKCGLSIDRDLNAAINLSNYKSA